MNGKNLKIIAGLANFNCSRIMEVVIAADIARATYLDVAANPEIVKEVRRITKLPLCVSSISLIDLYDCAVEGVDLVEIGNYDYFYTNNIVFSAKQVLNLAREAIRVFPGMKICATVPCLLPIDHQIALSYELDKIGIQALQTESLGAYKACHYLSITSMIYSAIPLLLSTYVISRSVCLPVIASSGINSILALLAILYGASSVGLGSSVRNYANTLMKALYIGEVLIAINKNKIIIAKNFITSVQNSSNLVL